MPRSTEPFQTPHAAMVSVFTLLESESLIFWGGSVRRRKGTASQRGLTHLA